MVKLINPLLEQLPRVSKTFNITNKKNIITHNILIEPYDIKNAELIFQSVQTSIEHLKRFILQNQTQWKFEQIQSAINQAMLDWDAQKNYYFSVKDINSNKIIGSILLADINHVHRYAHLGCWISKDYVGSEIAVLSSLYILYLGIKQMKLMRIEMVIDVNNKISFNTMKRLPAIYEGILRNRLSIDNEAFDAHVFSITPNELAIIEKRLEFFIDK